MGLQVTLTCDIGWANGIVSLLSKQPYELAVAIVPNLQAQIAAQVAAANTPPAPPPVAPVPPATPDPTAPQGLETEGTAPTA